MFWKILSCVHIPLLSICVWKPNIVMSDKEWRLPTIIRPLNYAIFLEVPHSVFSGDKFEYSGSVLIDIEATETTRQIKLHASAEYIKLESVKLGDSFINRQDYSVDPITEVLSIIAPFELRRNNTFKLRIKYTGVVNTRTMDGFYLSRYYAKDKVPKYLVTTQFETTYARKAFPCFDEPSFKSTFEMSILHPRRYIALFNTPGTILNLREFWVLAEFEKTTTMPTYLIAYVISDLTCTDGKSIENVSYSVCSRPQSNSHREFALEFGPKALAILNQFTDFDFGKSIPKLHQVAIPDFSSGAMENWGLITYREERLLWDPAESTMAEKKEVAMTIVHELTHSWFGNLVTCEWWSVVFLNEGFATLFQHLVTAEAFPSWNLDKQYIVDDLQKLLIADSLRAETPLDWEVKTPEETNLKFDLISYVKGSAIFRMVRNMMGHTAFRSGLRNYLHKFAYSTAQPGDLWESLEVAINKSYSKMPVDNLAEIMSNWVKLSGFPLLTVNVHGSKITIKQERFLLLEKDSNSRWYIPLCYTTSEDKNKFECNEPQVWMPAEAEKSFQISLNKHKWFMINGQTGYFRVIYDPENRENIRKALLKYEFDGIPELDRAILVDDLFSNAHIGKIKYKEVFRFLEFMRNDLSYYTWKSTIKHFLFMLNIVNGESKLGKAMSGRFLQLMNSMYEKISFTMQNKHDLLDTLKQRLILDSACRFGSTSCIESCSELFRKYKNNGIRPLKNVRSIVYCHALKHSKDNDDYRFLLDKYEESKNPLEKTSLYKALRCFPDVIFRTGNPSKSFGETSADGDSNKDSRISKKIALKMPKSIRYSLKDLYHRFSSDSLMMGEVHDMYLLQEHLEKMESWMKLNDENKYNTNKSKSFEMARFRAEWKEKYIQELTEIFVSTQAEKAEMSGAGKRYFLIHVTVFLPVIYTLFQIL